MKTGLAKQKIRRFVKEMNLRDVSELKTWCEVSLKVGGNNALKIDNSVYNAQEIYDFIHNDMHSMTFPEFKQSVKRTLNDLGSPEANQMHMVLGVVTEAAEVADAYKKNFAYNTELDLINVSEEIGGDVMWYVANWYNMTGYSIYRSMFSNIEKLKRRYPDGFDEEKAVNRDLETERNALEEFSGINYKND